MRLVHEEYVVRILTARIEEGVRTHEEIRRRTCLRGPLELGLVDAARRSILRDVSGVQTSLQQTDESVDGDDGLPRPGPAVHDQGAVLPWWCELDEAHDRLVGRLLLVNQHELLVSGQHRRQGLHQLLRGRDRTRVEDAQSAGFIANGHESSKILAELSVLSLEEYGCQSQ